MEANNANRAPADTRGGVAAAPANVVPAAAATRPLLNRVDSRTNFPTPAPRPVAPTAVTAQQHRPQFQPGGPLNNPPQFAPRPGTPAPRGPLPSGPVPSQQGQVLRPQVPLQRPSGPQTINPQQLIRLPQQPSLGQVPQRAPPPNNLQFGPRQPPQLGGPPTPDGKVPFPQQQNGGIRNGAPPGSILRPLLENQRPNQTVGQFPRQPSQGSLKGPDTFGTNTNKQVNLDNQSIINENHNVNRPDNGPDISMAAKNRSYSIAAAPGAPSPLKMDDDRRKSISAIGARVDELSGRGPGLGFIQEGKSEIKETGLRGSRESVRSEASNEGREVIPDRPESRLSGSKMSESFIGSFTPSTPKKRSDDDDDVILQNNKLSDKYPANNQNLNKMEISDRSPSLTRSDDSPEPKQQQQQQQHPSVLPNKPIPKQIVTTEQQRSKTPVEVTQSNQPNKDTSSINPVNMTPKTVVQESKSPIPINKKPTELYTTSPIDSKKSTPRKAVSAPKVRPKDGDNDSGVDESTQGNDVNGSPSSPNKKVPSKLPTKEKSSNGIVGPPLSRSSSKSATAKTPENPMPTDKKKVPMNKVQVGNAPSPNIKAVKSKIGSLENATYKPGGGKVKIENRKLDFQKATPKIAAKNDAYMPSGGSKKITTTKLEWTAKSKIGSLQNTAYKPGGGDKKIETVKLDFKEKAKPKVASTVNITHKPGGGAVKSSETNNGTRAIENQKLDFKAQSKVGSLDNVKHKPGGGDIKIFDDKDYIKNVGGQSPALSHSGQEDYYMSIHEWTEEDEMRPLSRCKSARAPRTPRTLSPRRRLNNVSAVDEEERRVLRNNERNRRPTSARPRPTSARDPPRSACARTSSTIQNRPAFTVY